MMLRSIPIREMAWFAISGVIGLLVDVAVLYALKELLGPYLARLLSFFAAVVATWLVNRSVTFKSRPSGMSLFAEFAKYFMLMIGGGLANYVVFALMVFQFDFVKEQPFWGVAAGSIVGMGFNFLSSRKMVFRKASTAPSAKLNQSGDKHVSH